ncbi:hypothetical protein DH2020_035772 [Rehmannia glutinosa]|uniref:Uncharacterized protein n=1 Tax=Rehmannia glutinosa TaxID=99300 RepID=A0ABR0V5G2_REHGL
MESLYRGRATPSRGGDGVTISGVSPTPVTMRMPVANLEALFAAESVQVTGDQLSSIVQSAVNTLWARKEAAVVKDGCGIPRLNRARATTRVGRQSSIDETELPAKHGHSSAKRSIRRNYSYDRKRTGDGDSNRALEAYAKSSGEVLSIGGKREGPEISFGPKDEQVSVAHNDAMVITTTIANYEVARAMVNLLARSMYYFMKPT